jgi:predicted nucleotidyltransferase
MEASYEYLKQNNLILFEVVAGSIAYGTKTSTSDVDIRYVYILPNEYLLGYNKYVPQVSENNNDTVGYELGRFIDLLVKQTPNTIELLYSPKDCVLHKHPVFDILIENRDLFLTKQCKMSFGGFAIQQIKKSKGHNKKMNWEEKQIERKGVLDFCYVVDGGKTKNVQTWLEENNASQSNCGLVKLNNMPFCYALYLGHGYKGICSQNGNDVLLTSIPKGAIPAITMYFNKDAYSIHCKKYREYQEWLKNRNMARFVDVKNHGQKIDGKNLLHSRRLVDMAIEIAETGTINVRRPNADYLLQIRRGEIPLERIIEEAEKDLARLDEVYEKCKLPESVDAEFAHNLVIEIRNKINWI